MSGDGRIGLFGGTFDPIHTGHLILAQVAADFVGLERVLFMPTAIPPHKRPGEITPFEDRVSMVALAIEDNTLFELSRIEGSDGVTFTFETVLRFGEMGYGRDRLHLLVGSDSLGDMRLWKNPGVIFENATIVTMMRPGFEEFPSFPDGSGVIIMNTGVNSISSNEIRKRVREGRSIRYLVPRAVEQYIEEHSLYKDEA